MRYIAIAVYDIGHTIMEAEKSHNICPRQNGGTRKPDI